MVTVNGVIRDAKTKHIGCFIGDHVKTAIGTILNTGTVLGTGSNIALKGFPPKQYNHFHGVWVRKFVELNGIHLSIR